MYAIVQINHSVSLNRPWGVGAEWCRNIYLSIITGGGVGTKTHEVDDVFPPDDLWFGSDIYSKCTVLYIICIKNFLMIGYVICM